MEKIRSVLKKGWMVESYLFKLMIRQNRLEGLLIILFGLIGRFWWNIGAPYIEKYLIDEFVDIYINNKMTTSVFILIFVLLGGKVLVNLLSAISEIVQEYVQNKATLYLDKKVMLRVANADAAYFDDPENRDAIQVANESKRVVSENIGWSVSMVTSVVGFVATASVFLVLNPLLGMLFLFTYVPAIGMSLVWLLR